MATKKAAATAATATASAAAAGGVGPLAKKPAAGAIGGQQGIKGVAKLIVPSGEAKPGPGIGQALGPLGLNMAEFCKQFNADTSKLKPGIPIPVIVTAMKDRTFTFKRRSPPTSWFIKQCAGIEKGASTPGFERKGKITLKQVYEIAVVKREVDPTLPSVEALCRCICGSAKSMGVEVVGSLAGDGATVGSQGVAGNGGAKSGGEKSSTTKSATS